MKRYLALEKIVTYGSFSKAADDLGYTQSALSQTIASLEDELGFRLLQRSRMGSSLTDEGKELFPFIEKTIFQYRATIEKAKDIKGLKTGIIRMGTVGSISVNWLPSIIKKFHQQYPDVEFIIRQGDYTLTEEWINTGAIDFGFVLSNATSDLEIKLLQHDNFVAILPEGHPLSQKSVISLKELSDEPLIMLDMGKYSLVEQAFKLEHITPNVRYKLHDDYGIMAMVEAGMGVSLLADLITKRTSFKIVKRPVDPPIFRDICIGYKNKSSLPLASIKFINAIEEYVRSNEL
ncbi:MAG: LysR family transcriptional regulator [Lachnospiraceae bacterium]|nr:LysR family transcriptional regulator [Lachnospiraceae bacterium]